MIVETEDEAQGRATQLELILRHELDLLTPEELAQALRISEQTLAYWRGRGEGPPYTKAGKGVFYRRMGVDAWLTQNECNPVPKAA
jgi:hypothetical protein